MMILKTKRDKERYRNSTVEYGFGTNKKGVFLIRTNVKKVKKEHVYSERQH